MGVRIRLAMCLWHGVRVQNEYIISSIFQPGCNFRNVCGCLHLPIAFVSFYACSNRLSITFQFGVNINSTLIYSFISTSTSYKQKLPSAD